MSGSVSQQSRLGPCEWMSENWEIFREIYEPPAKPIPSWIVNSIRAMILTLFMHWER